jgi:hypothetical protein
MLRDMWRHMVACHALYLGLMFVCGGTRSVGYRQSLRRVVIICSSTTCVEHRLSKLVSRCDIAV